MTITKSIMVLFIKKKKSIMVSNAVPLCMMWSFGANEKITLSMKPQVYILLLLFNWMTTLSSPTSFFNILELLNYRLFSKVNLLYTACILEVFLFFLYLLIKKKNMRLNYKLHQKNFDLFSIQSFKFHFFFSFQSYLIYFQFSPSANFSDSFSIFHFPKQRCFGGLKDSDLTEGLHLKQMEVKELKWK